MSKLLFDESPIVVDRVLAKKLGLNEALVVQQIHYWIQANKKKNINCHDGRYWTYNSIAKWHEDEFSFWSYDTVKRTFATLEKLGIFMTGNYNKEKRDRTKWYSIDYDKLSEIAGRNDSSSSIEYCPPSEGVTAKPFENAAPNALGQNAPMPLGQNAPMHQGEKHRPLPEISTKTSTEIYNQSFSQSSEQIPDWIDGPTDHKPETSAKQIKAKACTYTYTNPTDQTLLDGAIDHLLSLRELRTRDAVYSATAIRAHLERLTLDMCDVILQRYKDAMEYGSITKPAAYLDALIINTIREWHAISVPPPF